MESIYQQTQLLFSQYPLISAAAAATFLFLLLLLLIKQRRKNHIPYRPTRNVYTKERVTTDPQFKQPFYIPPQPDDGVNETEPEESVSAAKMVNSEPTLSPVSTASAQENIENDVENGETAEIAKNDITTSENITSTPVDIPKKNLIIALYVTVNTEQFFTGKKVFAALEEVGLNYGKMKIFHHHGMGELKTATPVFSIASMVKPGTFDPAQMHEFSTPGLVLFMQLPGPFGGRVAFELMLNSAKRLAEILKGDLKDETHQLINPAIVEQLRLKIAQFEGR